MGIKSVTLHAHLEGRIMSMETGGVFRNNSAEALSIPYVPKIKFDIITF